MEVQDDSRVNRTDIIPTLLSSHTGQILYFDIKRAHTVSPQSSDSACLTQMPINWQFRKNELRMYPDRCK